MRNTTEFTMEITLPKTRKAKEKFEKIIAAADNEFFLNGYEKTTIATIAATADIAVGTFYLYFKDKMSLYYYILFDYQKRITKYIASKIKNCETRYEKERLGLIAWLEFVNENPHTYNIIFQSLIIDRNLFVDYYKKFSETYTRGLLSDTEQLIDENYETISLALMGISSFLGFKQMFEERKLTDEEINDMADTIMRMLKDGLFQK